MIPSVPLRGPQYFCGVVQKPEKGLARVDVTIRLFSNRNLLLSCFGVYRAQFDALFPSLPGFVIDGLAVWKPFETGPALKLNLQGSGLHIDALAFLNIKDDRIGFGQHFTRQRVNDGERLWAKLPGWNELQVREASRVPRVHPVCDQLRGIWRPEHRRPLLHVLSPLCNHWP